ncbi:MAG TPA: hypothetical protein VFF82_02925, partial [Rhodocyclaceae bacterium]|nr:hypothetical protein [Rhodocyclaceae bacterium]
MLQISCCKRLTTILMVVMLAGCASEQARKEGLALLDQGRYEEGLARLEAAAKEFPDDLSFRTALKNHRDMV